MSERDRDQLLDELIRRPLERESLLREAGIAESERRELLSLVDVSDALWLNAQGAPPIADDPVAAMLGLVPDLECSLDAKALTLARKRANLLVSSLASLLRARGWSTHQADVFRWENETSADVPPALIQAIAEILGTPVEKLILPPERIPLGGPIGEVRNSQIFSQLVSRWANARNVTVAVATAMLESRMLATVHRGGSPDAEQLLVSLDALVTAVEQPKQQ
jgi:hypothetical protein